MLYADHGGREKGEKREEGEKRKEVRGDNAVAERADERNSNLRSVGEAVLVFAGLQTPWVVQ